MGSDTTNIFDGVPSVISQTFSAFSKICIPLNTRVEDVQTVHLLTHGGTLDHTYWDYTSDYSYVDAAAERGYATLSYDRLGTGYSQHPDPIQVVQTAVQVELLHVLVSFLKIGKIGGHCFSDVIRIAHSLGSAYMQAVSARYPDGFSALVLTGYSAFLPGSSIGITSMAQQIANTLPPEQFSGLASGYITQCPLLQCLQFEFYYEPYYDTEILERQVESRQTTALGETLTVMDAFPLALEFKKPVFIFNGEKDYFYCQGSCNGTHDITGGALALFLPNAAVTSMAENLPNTGHSINIHFSAGVGFRKMLDFISSTGV